MSGMYVREEFYEQATRQQPDFESTDLQIAVKLKKENKAFKVEKYEHNYPHCWRTDKPILYYPLDSWFVRASKARDRMAELNKTHKLETGPHRYEALSIVVGEFAGLESLTLPFLGNSAARMAYRRQRGRNLYRIL